MTVFGSHYYWNISTIVCFIGNGEINQSIHWMHVSVLHLVKNMLLWEHGL